MGYEILYKRFLVLEKNGFLTPYIIYGSSNCYYSYSHKRERNLVKLEKSYAWILKNLFKDYSDNFVFGNSELRLFLAKVYDHLKPDIDSGYFKRAPLTKKAFIDGFYKKIISHRDFNSYIGSDPILLDDFLTVKTRYKDFIKLIGDK